MAFKLSTRSLKNRHGVDPKLIEISNLAIQITVVDFGHPTDAGVRTDERQFALYSAGKSQCDGIDNISFHQKAMALDFYAFVGGRASWDSAHLAIVACAFLQAASLLEIKLQSGILWSGKRVINGVRYGWDAGHIQLMEDV